MNPEDDPSSRRAVSGFSRWEAWSLTGIGVVAAAVLATGIFFAVSSSSNDDSGFQVPPGATAPDELEQPDPEVADDGGANGIADLPAPEWIRSTAEATDIPPRALRAYAGATIRTAQTHPDCNLAWNTLAAIGDVESRHGGIFGAEIEDNGDLTEPVIGVPLDGGEGVAAIEDTDDGELDGDTEWDRAVGPMQFIPQTWNRFAADGNGDGVEDPQNIDDAALAAATYLCADDRDLSDQATWIEAVSSYNVGVDYNNRIVESANRYAAAT